MNDSRSKATASVETSTTHTIIVEVPASLFEAVKSGDDVKILLMPTDLNMDRPIMPKRLTPREVYDIAQANGNTPRY